MYSPVNKTKAQNAKLMSIKKQTAKEISSAVFAHNGICLTTAPQPKMKYPDKKDILKRARGRYVELRKETIAAKSHPMKQPTAEVVSSNYSLNKRNSAIAAKLSEKRRQQMPNPPPIAKNLMLPAPTSRHRTASRNQLPSRDAQPVPYHYPYGHTLPHSRQYAELVEKGIQTNKAEILNHSLIVGEVKYILPSRNVVIEIERDRREAKKRALLKVKRKFEEHSEKQEQHLTDLKDFLEKACVTRRTRKPREALEMDKKLMKSMDEFFAKEMPKVESITNIKERIKRKELELLNLFDNVDTFKITSDTTKD
ncbi:uncharacterized protein LOC119689161 [Teleopsis dalmanni]|uniref:uncharacterized protein LOC119681168 n=1 Tax=Teleopsis dalmanni TaxID=139649 RepID=UPI0018CF5475|nr:uncharacterized protein LOC119681168 [Teleopsis dalmanni]XP_037959855.1 uncharacterized protein LOC119689161 [Teleopsis dalmanni]